MLAWSYLQKATVRECLTNNLFSHSFLSASQMRVSHLHAGTYKEHHLQLG